MNSHLLNKYNQTMLLTDTTSVPIVNADDELDVRHHTSINDIMPPPSSTNLLVNYLTATNDSDRVTILTNLVLEQTTELGLVRAMIDDLNRCNQNLKQSNHDLLSTSHALEKKYKLSHKTLLEEFEMNKYEDQRLMQSLQGRREVDKTKLKQTVKMLQQAQDHIHELEHTNSCLLSELNYLKEGYLSGTITSPIPNSNSTDLLGDEVSPSDYEKQFDCEQIKKEINDHNPEEIEKNDDIVQEAVNKIVNEIVTEALNGAVNQDIIDNSWSHTWKLDWPTTNSSFDWSTTTSSTTSNTILMDSDRCKEIPFPPPIYIDAIVDPPPPCIDHNIGPDEIPFPFPTPLPSSPIPPILPISPLPFPPPIPLPCFDQNQGNDYCTISTSEDSGL